MRVYKQEVKRNPWAAEVSVSRTRNGRWVIRYGSNGSEVPASTFSNWDEAEWTANAWANEEHDKESRETLNVWNS